MFFPLSDQSYLRMNLILKCYPPEGYRSLSEALYRHLLEIPFHNRLQNVETTIPKVVVLSIRKGGCENYLFCCTSRGKNYRLPFEIKHLGVNLRNHSLTRTFQCRVRKGERKNVSFSLHHRGHRLPAFNNECGCFTDEVDDGWINTRGDQGGTLFTELNNFGSFDVGHL
jgi:hypothetical protein